MAKHTTQETVNENPVVNVADLVKNLSAADLAKLLAETRKAEKARKEAIASLPQFAFLVVMADSSHVVWAGRAADYAAARQEALEHAAAQGEVFMDTEGNAAIVARPLPKPRGRKAKSDSAESTS